MSAFPSLPLDPGIRTRLGFALLLGPVLLVAMDGSILFLAMPSISRALHPSADQALWILHVYGLAVGSLLITFGNLGDRYGRLRMLIIGSTAFGISSIAAAMAPTPELLIIARACMGIAGATLLPSALAIVSALFPDPRRRGRAIGVFAAAFAAGFGIGPVLGGLLLAHAWWGAVFLINLPVLAIFLMLAPMLLREVTPVAAGQIDLLSVVTSAAGLLLTVYGVTHAAAEGMSILAVASVSAGLGVLIWFGVRQRHLRHPLVDLTLFHDRLFTIAVLTGFLPLAAWSATAYLSGIYLQSVLGLPVLAAALLALPGAGTLIAMCLIAPRIADRIGTGATLVVCHLTIAAGLLLLLLTNTSHGAEWYVAASVISAIGYGISFAVVADTAIGAAPPERAAAAGAIAETSNELGNALGIALFGSIAAVLFRMLGPGMAPTLDETLQLPQAMDDTVVVAKSAFLTGLHVVAVIAAALHIGMAAITARGRRGTAPVG